MARLIVGFLVLTLGCAGELEAPPGEGGGSVLPDAGLEPDAEPPPMEFAVDRLLEDGDILGGAAIEAADVQAFLEESGSALAHYRDPMTDRSAAAVIAERSHAYGVSPLYMLARIQTESSLISSGTTEHLDAATGCGCPDGTGCNPELDGFGNQIECAAMKMRGYYDDLDAGRPTIAGWAVGEARETGDPCVVTPANKATAALYTYTPWVGAYGIGCGRADIGGSSLVALAYHRFLAAYPWPL